MNHLAVFYANEPMREALHGFMIQVLREQAADDAMKGEKTDGYENAGYCVDSVFDKLAELYENKKEPTATNSR